VELAPCASVHGREVASDRAEHVALGSGGPADGAFVVFVGVDGLQDAVCRVSPGRDPQVVRPLMPLIESPRGCSSKVPILVVVSA